MNRFVKLWFLIALISPITTFARLPFTSFVSNPDFLTCSIGCFQTARSCSSPYDGADEATADYDDSLMGSFSYVGAVVRTQKVCLNQSASFRTLFGGLVEFLAAESGTLLPVKYDPISALQQGADATTVVPDSYVIVREGQSAMPSPGTIFSGSMGETVADAAAGVPHGTISVTTAGEIRAAGGSVTLAPELTRGGNINWSHVNVIEGGESSVFDPQIPNPIPKAGRIQ